MSKIISVETEVKPVVNNPIFIIFILETITSTGIVMKKIQILPDILKCASQYLH